MILSYDSSDGQLHICFLFQIHTSCGDDGGESTMTSVSLSPICVIWNLDLFVALLNTNKDFLSIYNSLSTTERINHLFIML